MSTELLSLLLEPFRKIRHMFLSYRFKNILNIFILPRRWSKVINPYIWVCDRGNPRYRADPLGFRNKRLRFRRSPFNRGYLRRQEELEAQTSHASWSGLLLPFLDSKTLQEVITRPRVPLGSMISRPSHLPDQATSDQSQSRSWCILVPV